MEKTPEPKVEAPMEPASADVTPEVEIRECRCMFCGKLMLLSSETEAVRYDDMVFSP